MKVLHLSAKFSESSAGYRLHLGLMEKGYDSNVLINSTEKHLKGQTTISYYTKMKIYLSYIISDLMTRKVNKLKNGQHYSASLGINKTIIQEIEKINPDIIHLHWINGGLVQIESLKYFNKPIVWTLHDSWAFTGGCHIPYACKKYNKECDICPKFTTESIKLSKKVLKKKMSEWKDIDMTIISPSNWMYQCAKESKLLKNKSHKVIPNGINTNIFTKKSKVECRKKLGLELRKKKILFGAVNGNSDPNKGYYIVEKVIDELEKYKDSYELIIFGDKFSEELNNKKIKIYQMGFITDLNKMCELYSASDLFLCPSISENLPNTIIESMACGTPVVAFNIGGISDIIEDNITGKLVKPYDIRLFIDSINEIILDENYEEVSMKCIEKVKKHYSVDLIVDRHVELYQSLLNRNNGD